MFNDISTYGDNIPMADDIAAALIYQIKKEIAERYFGTRKAIEEEKQALQERLQAHRDTVVKTVYGDFCQIYQLLHSAPLIEEFWEALGLKNKPFYDRYLENSRNTKACPLSDQKVRGLTLRGKYKNLLLECYRRVFDHLKPYREGYQELLEECLVINEEIDQLSANYRLSDILAFVRSIEGLDSLTGVLGETIVPTQRQDLEEKLTVIKLDCPGKDLVEIPPLPPLNEVKSRLKQLATKAHHQTRREGLKCCS